MKFKEGDFVRLLRGWTKMRVVRVNNSIVYAQYCGICPDPHYEATRHGHYDQDRRHSEFVLWDINDPACTTDHTPLNGDNDMTTNSTAGLYQTNTKTPRYGTFLIKNNSGQFVLEMKGANGGVEAFDEDKITKVVPYTFSAKGQYRGQTQTTHYACTKGAVKQGDVLVSESGNLYYVTKINTACETPRKTFKGSKLTSKPII